MNTIGKQVLRTIVVFIGSLLIAVGFNSLMIPHEILAGGVSGIAMLVQNITGFPAGTQYIIYNIPLFLIGWRFLGLSFLIYSIFGTFFVSIFMNTIPVIPQIYTDDILLASVFGGAIAGVGVGIVIKGGGSTGGLDIVGVIIQKYLNIPIGSLSMGINAIIICLSIAYFNISQAMYTLISMVVFAKTIDLVLISSAKKTVIIISAETERMAAEIHNKMYRGATYLHGEGSYSQVPMRVLVCVVTRYELFKIQEIIYQNDPSAFVTITDTQDVRGSFRKQSPFSPHVPMSKSEM